MKFGISEASTHTNEGGTGIGLLDTWTFKKKYHVSLIIEELDNNIYSKRLSFLFDGKNRYLIISSRYQQIISYQTRSDLLVISSSENNATYLALSCVYDNSHRNANFSFLCVTPAGFRKYFIK